MKPKYEIKEIPWGSMPRGATMEDYQKALETAAHVYKNSFAEVVDYLGFTPKRCRAGYSAMIGENEFIITRIWGGIS